MRKVFVVEDDTALQELYMYSLENKFDCRCFSDGDSFFDAVSDDAPDIILLDIMLPGDDGYVILSRLKSNIQTAHIPVIMIPAKGEEISMVKGLNMGADDYIAKPFGVLALIARIRANLRKNAKPAENENIAFKYIYIDLQRHQVTAGGNTLKLSLKEFNLLRLLCENHEKVQEREMIFKTVWSSDFIGETRTLDIHIKELRKKLIEAGSLAEIETVRGVGYMLV